MKKLKPNTMLLLFKKKNKVSEENKFIIYTEHKGMKSNNGKYTYLC